MQWLLQAYPSLEPRALDTERELNSGNDTSNDKKNIIFSAVVKKC